jgi:hypothetical protein
MKTFSIKPFFDMRDKSWPSEVAIELPQGAQIAVEQFANFVYWHIHFNPEVKTTIKRTVILAVAGDIIPDAYQYIGTLLPYIEPDATDDDTQSSNEPSESDALEMPTEEEFYENYRLINVYAAPEPAAKIPLQGWSLGKGNYEH